mgnify:FL=1|jgi:hypothetical protein
MQASASARQVLENRWGIAPIPDTHKPHSDLTEIRVSDEGIARSLSTKSGIGAVPGHEANIITHWKKLFANRVDQLFVIAPWKISAAN